jgi:regulator of PEP synthase PpsR (kinase-PPPase family)
MSELKFFLDVRTIRDDRDIYLCQDKYINKLTIEYLIDAFKTFSFSLSSNFIVSTSDHLKSNSNSNSISSDSLMNFFLKKKYRKINSICYLANITRSDVAKAIFKLAEHLINLELDHLHAINHCLQYLYETKYLIIKYSLARDDKLIIQFLDHDRDQTFSTKNKHVFENTIDVSFANNLEQRSYERFTFKLYDDMID